MDLENTLRMTDHLALTRDGIYFNTQQGRRWINHVFQTKIEEMKQELRTSSNGGGRVRGNVPEPLASRLGPLATETGAVAPVAPSSDVRERCVTAPPPRQPLESRLGRQNDQNQTSSQTVARTNNPSTATPASAGIPSTSAATSEGIEPGSELLWNRPHPSGWGEYKTEISTNLNMNTLTCRADAKKMMGGVSGLYRIPGLDWLLAEQEQFSSATTLMFVDFDGSPQDNTFGPLNTRSLTDFCRRARVDATAPEGQVHDRKKSPITNKTRYTGSSPNRLVRCPVSTREIILERPR